MKPTLDKQLVPNAPPHAFNVANGAKHVGTSKAKLYEEHKAGRIEFLKIGGRTFVTREEVERWFHARAKPMEAA